MSKNSDNKINKDKSFLGKEKISKLLLKMSLPAIIGMMVMTMYNIVDSIFIGKWVGALGLAGVVVVFPFMMILIAVAQFFGIGAASIISRSYGEKNFVKAQKTFQNVIFVVVVLLILTISAGMLFMDKILYFLGTTENIFPFAKTYFSILIFGLGFQVFTASTNNIIRSVGAAKTAMVVMLLGAGLNLILDPIFIVFLKMGVAGAAWATIISQFISFVFSICYFLSDRSFLKFSFVNFKLNFKLIKEIIFIGFPSFIRQASMSIVAILTNNLLAIHGSDLAIASYGIVFRLMMVLVMPGVGILQGANPIIGYNFGAKLYNRVKATLILSYKSSTIIISSLYVILFVFSKEIISIFTNNIELLAYVNHIMKIILFFFPLLGFQLISTGYFQAIGDSKKAFIISLLRQIIILIPLLIILPRFFNLNGIWYSFPIADLISGIIVFFIMVGEFKKLKTKTVLQKN